MYFKKFTGGGRTLQIPINLYDYEKRNHLYRIHKEILDVDHKFQIDSQSNLELYIEPKSRMTFTFFIDSQFDLQSALHGVDLLADCTIL